MSLKVSAAQTVTPESAGWSYTGLRLINVAAGVAQTLTTEADECFVIPINGSVSLDINGAFSASFDLKGRPTVFTHVTDVAYVGRDCTLSVSSELGATVAIATARCTTALAPAYLPASDAAVEVRGAGAATRQVTGFGVPGVFDGAERLMACEVITPAGNWSSYPPHKHDTTTECASEEIYWYRIDGGPDGFGLHRTYTGDEHIDAGLRPLDETMIVRDGDVVLVPHGYHGPCIAPPDYPMYYLNVLAGPGPRSMAFCDDPAHAWIRAGWEGQQTDPRCPVTSVGGPR